jgi:cytidine deaminase
VNPLDLIEAAQAAIRHAHAPYSGYRVGAALLCEDGSVFTGCNVENASYGLTLCAERTALVSAVAAGHRAFEALAIAASGDPTPYPCGACRQVLAEFCSANMPVYVAREDGCETIPLGELLPHAFGASDG